MFAGHGRCRFNPDRAILTTPCSETTSHTLSATLGFLAIHREEQDKAIKEIQQNIPIGKDPVSVLKQLSSHSFFK